MGKVRRNNLRLNVRLALLNCFNFALKVRCPILPTRC